MSMPNAFPFLIAAPSCVLPAGIEENCRHLAPLVDEAGLCFFESGSCLAYSDQDLPPSLAHLDLSFHVHLPLDLDWSRGGAETAGVCLRLADKVSRLAPRAFVLHPPDTPEELASFVRAWERGGRSPRTLLLENIEGNDLSGLMNAIEELDCLICLDTGHALAYGHPMLLSPGDFFQRVRMLHLYAPGPSHTGGHGHASLDQAREGDIPLLRQILTRFTALAHSLGEDSPAPCCMLELFHPERLARSLRALGEWMAEAATSPGGRP